MAGLALFGIAVTGFFYWLHFSNRPLRPDELTVLTDRIVNPQIITRRRGSKAMRDLNFTLPSRPGRVFYVPDVVIDAFTSLLNVPKTFGSGKVTARVAVETDSLTDADADQLDAVDHVLVVELSTSAGSWLTLDHYNAARKSNARGFFWLANIFAALQLLVYLDVSVRWIARRRRRRTA